MAGGEAQELATRYLDAANAHDIAGMAALWEPGGTEHFPTFQQSFRVPDEFAQHFESLFAAFPDVRWDVVSVAIGDGLVVARSQMKGTHLGAYQGIAATGKTITVDTVDFLRIRNRRIYHNDVIFDGLTILRQIGALPPAGSRRERSLQTAFNSLKATTSRAMVYGEATTTIARSARDILEFVIDLDKYREADHKFHHIHFVKRDNDHGTAKYSGKLRGVPTPAEIQDWTLEPYRRLEFRSRPTLWPGMIARFEGFFECKETVDGTLVRHREAFFFNPPFSWLARPFLSSWLQEDVEAEVIRLKALLERA